jgi:peptidoglycan/xylan/chitin deacetylase (PgdA/CDA1 family)
VRGGVRPTRGAGILGRMRPSLDSILRAIGVLLYRLRLHPLVIRLRRARPRVLLYHDCDEAESPFTRGLGTNVAPADLAVHLDFLLRHYTVVPLAALLEGRAPERAVALTFDDGYRSVYTHARPLLLARRLPATLYLATAAIGNEELIWVNELNYLLRTHPEAVRREAAPLLGTAGDDPPEAVLARARLEFDAARIRLLLTRLRAGLGIDARTLAREARLYLDREEIATLGREGFTFGSHTHSHPDLARLDAQALREELRRSREAVRALPGAIDSLAYPFGSHTAEVRRRALEAGYRSMVLVGGAASRRVDATRVARIPVTRPGEANLFAEMEVVTPIRARLRLLLGRTARALDARS